jgi:hypothetical protein
MLARSLGPQELIVWKSMVAAVVETKMCRCGASVRDVSRCLTPTIGLIGRDDNVVSASVVVVDIDARSRTKRA